MRRDKKLVAKGGKMTVKVYPVLCECIQDGVTYGYNRAFKHDESPGENEIIDAVYDGVLNAICERFSFGDYDEEAEYI